MSVVHVTFVRHGESTDNLKNIWAGWKDSPLSNHGMNQARAAGQSLSSTPFTAIYASDLLRAHMTAKAIHAAQQSEPRPLLTVSPLLREQHFGIAEGQIWTNYRTPGLTDEEHLDRNLFPTLSGRCDKFPEGESLDDLQKRATKAIDELVMPHVWQALKEGRTNVHIALVSHGLCISELAAALVRQDFEVKRKNTVVIGRSYSGLLNTAWTRISIDAPVVKQGVPLEFSEADPPALVIQVTEVNRHEHLEAVKRQQGGIGSSTHDPNQTDIRAFFGGATVRNESEG